MELVLTGLDLKAIKRDISVWRVLNCQRKRSYACLIHKLTEKLITFSGMTEAEHANKSVNIINNPKRMSKYQSHSSSN